MTDIAARKPRSAQREPGRAFHYEALERIAALTAENRKLRSADHDAVLDLELALYLLTKSGGDLVAVQRIRRAASRLYREGSAIKREAA